MTTKMRRIDMGGMDLTINSLEIGVTKAGRTGTGNSISGTELATLDGVTAGTAAASKALVADSNIDVTGVRNFTVTGNLSGGFTRTVVEDGASVILTAAQSGGLCVFDKTDGALFTLPTPVVGLHYEFIVDTVVSSGSAKVITSAGTVFIKGTVNAIVTGTDADLAADAANGSSHVAITMNGTTTGGIAGTRFTLTCRSATVWEITGIVIKSGSVATSFATS